MNRHIIFTALALMGICSYGQEDKTNIVVFENNENTLKVTTGARFIGDMAILKSDFTPLNSGAKISEARMRMSFVYNKLDMYIDVDFGGGHATQKNLFARYTFSGDENSFYNLKVGYYAEPFSMNANTSKSAIHFITRPSFVSTLGPGRSLGASFIYGNKYVFTNTGVFSENKYNSQSAGNQGYSIGGRYLGYIVNNGDMTAHVGMSLRYSTIRTGKLDAKNQVLNTELNVKAPLENAVDGRSEFTEMRLPWASDAFAFGFEGLFHSKKVFARGEYSFTTVGKERSDEELFKNQLGGLYSWTTLESWKKGNPLEDTKYQGGYIEAGYLIRGDKYNYDRNVGSLKGLSQEGDIELVGRVSYTGMNDIKDGDIYIKGRDQFYPKGVIKDYPATSTSFAGGKSVNYTIGCNYAFNKHAQVMVAYTMQKLDNVRYELDKNFNFLQARLMVNF